MRMLKKSTFMNCGDIFESDKETVMISSGKLSQLPLVAVCKVSSSKICSAKRSVEKVNYTSA